MTEDPDPASRVVRNDEVSRYEIRIGDAVAGFAAFRGSQERVVFTHTVIEPEFEGRGLGSTLVGDALADVSARGATIVPLCPFVRSWLKRHPDFDGAVDESPVAP